MKFRSSQKDMKESSFNQSIFQGIAAIRNFGACDLCFRCALDVWYSHFGHCLCFDATLLQAFLCLWAHPGILELVKRHGYGMMGWLWGWKSGILVQGSFSPGTKNKQNGPEKIRLNCPPPTGNESSSNHWVTCVYCIYQKVFRSCGHVIFLSLQGAT